MSIPVSFHLSVTECQPFHECSYLYANTHVRTWKMLKANKVNKNKLTNKRDDRPQDTNEKRKFNQVICVETIWETGLRVDLENCSYLWKNSGHAPASTLLNRDHAEEITAHTERWKSFKKKKKGKRQSYLSWDQYILSCLVFLPTFALWISMAILEPLRTSLFSIQDDRYFFNWIIMWL